MLASRQFSCRPNTLRMTLAWVAIGVPLVALTAWGQPRGVKDGEKIEVAPAVAPDIYRATAVKEDGQVVIRVSARENRLVNSDPDDPDAKDWIDCWTEMEPLVLGDQIRAYRPSGEKIDEAALLETLARPAAVACFQRTHKSDPERPDPFYADAFRDDLVLLVFEAKHWLR